jgi:hypothetical protein
MSTHANIAVVDINRLLGRVDTGEIISVYLHFDGRGACAGKILLENYNSYSAAMSLVMLGNMSVLGNTLEECTPYGERPTILELNEWVQKHFTQEFNYIFMSGRWFVYDSDDRNFTMLEDIV